MFIGKKLFDNGQFVSVKLVKGGAKADDVHGVDAVSGGTITSKGLEKCFSTAFQNIRNTSIKS